MKKIRENFDTNFETNETIGAGIGNTGNVHPKLKRNSSTKMMFVPKALFLPKTFPKVAYNAIFLLNFYERFSQFSKNFQSMFSN